MLAVVVYEFGHPSAKFQTLSYSAVRSIEKFH